MAEGDYLEGCSPEQRAVLEEINGPGLRALHGYLAQREAIAVLGAGASVPLYPLWGGVIDELIDHAAASLSESEAATCRRVAATRPDSVVEVVRRQLGDAEYREVLRQVFRVRRHPGTERTWTDTHELVARCNLRAVVTTNYDPGIVDVRMHVRSEAVDTGWANWDNDELVSRWRTGDVFKTDELPILYAHGHHKRPDHIVLATRDYRRAYSSRLPGALRNLIDAGHLVWIGFSFADQRISAILREVAETSGSRTDPGAAPRHVAIMPWDIDGAADAGLGGVGAGDATDPGILADLAGIDWGAELVLYPAPDGDHSSLQRLLATLTDSRFPATATATTAAVDTAPTDRLTSDDDSAFPDGKGAATATVPADPLTRADRAFLDDVQARWVHGGQPLDRFTGREDELARLERWAADPEVRLIAVEAWGGAGKTALVTEWLTARAGAGARPEIRGLFAWSFYEDRSGELWAEALIDWAESTFRVDSGIGSLADRVRRVARAVPLIVVLDGLEVLQEGPAGGEFGRLLDGTLRTALTDWCRQDHPGIAVLTSRFPFADLDPFHGEAARILDVPPLALDEGAALLAKAGAHELPDTTRRELVRAVDGHALAVEALGRVLAEAATTIPEAAGEVLDDLVRLGSTDKRVVRVLQFYADCLSPADRHLVAVVALFQRPVKVGSVLTIGQERAPAAFSGVTLAAIKTAVTTRLRGLLMWHPDSTISAHPLVRDTFRPLLLDPESAKLATDVSLRGLPEGIVTTKAAADVVAETIELLIAADDWDAADALYLGRSRDGQIWMTLPAARSGQQAALAFVADEHRRKLCGRRLGHHRASTYLNHAGMFSTDAGELDTGERLLRQGVAYDEGGDRREQILKLNNLSECLLWRGDAAGAERAAQRAVELGQDDRDRRSLVAALAFLARAQALAGRSTAADDTYAKVESTQKASGLGRLVGMRAVSMGEFLLETGRSARARELAETSREVCERQGWSDDVARCDRLLARCDLGVGRSVEARRRLEQAVGAFHEGELMLEWAKTLVDLARAEVVLGNLDEADSACAEVITFTRPRGLVTEHSLALCVRAAVQLSRADDAAPRRFSWGGRSDRGDRLDRQQFLEAARADADQALRLAQVTRHLPWAELEALEAHAAIDAAIREDHGWKARAMELSDDLRPAEVQRRQAWVGSKP